MVVDYAAAEDADRLFHALADGTRREILALVLTSEHSVSELARHFPMSFAAVQKHVAVLERAGLVAKQRQGREQRVTGDIARLRTAQHLLDDLETLWLGRIERISALLAGPPTTPPEHRPVVDPT